MPLVVVSGAIANKLNQGGEAWVRLSYLLGLRRLGYQVYFIEQIHRDACVDNRSDASAFETSANLAYFNEVMNEFELSDCATLLPVDRQGHSTVDANLLRLAESAEALINISGHLTLEPLLQRIGNKVFIDIDPGYTQYWHADGMPGCRVAGLLGFWVSGLLGAQVGCKKNGIAATFLCAVFVPNNESMRSRLQHREANVLTPLLLLGILGRRRGWGMRRCVLFEQSF